MPTVGLIGVGFIGKLFLDDLITADYDVVVFDIDDSKVEYAIERGATASDSPATLGRKVDIVLMSLPGSVEVEATLEGENGLLEGVDDGDLVIDVTTTHPETSVTCYEQCDEQNVRFIEAPITGGSPREGYHMMIGGRETDYRAATEILDVICSDHTRVGEIGKGTILKLALQMRYAGHNAVDAEVVEFCRDNDVDPEVLNEFLEMGIWENYFSGDFSQDIEGLGGLAIWHKDINYARQVARENGTSLPLNAAVNEAYKATVRRTDENEGHAATLIKYWQLLNNADLSDT
ncbi:MULTISPECIES: NAD(P)-dependent oxidoreductase [Natrialbaceae]|uniref:NAD(P)-dependent oxidoreductase n=1 Tax=Natrialbaceae TaxID=1644061 RepID=UPI00207C992C|nr:NAD(P)-dependent oxidoreductase [Natronococcus sp. CG52]